MRLTAINIHPVKSTAIRPLDEARVASWGLAGDRRWMVVDEAGEVVTARELHELFRIVADTPETGASVPLLLSSPGHPDLEVAEPDGVPVPVRLFHHELEAVPAGSDADAWVRDVAGRADLRLVWCDDPSRRSLNPKYARPEDHAAFPDAYPVTLASESSLGQLNDWMARTAQELGEDFTALPMQRFRPNLVVDGELPFAEDAWSRVRVGEAGFRVAKPVDRCVMSTIEPTTLATGKEPIRTLAKHRRWDGSIWFAVQMIPDSTGRIQVGDEVSAE